MPAIHHEIKKLGLLALFFALGFGYILIVMRLFMETFPIDGYIISKALVGALLAAKAVAIIDKTPLGNLFSESSRYLDLLYRTLLYTLLVMVFGVIERLVHAYWDTRSVEMAISTFLESARLNHFLGTILCVGVVFFIYNFLREINNYMGMGNLRKFFFTSPSESSND